MNKKKHTPKSEDIQPAQEVKRVVEQSAGFSSVYANDIQVQTSPWDMRLILGEVTKPATPDDPVLAVSQLGEVRISLQLAKRLADIMTDQIKSYEERFGPIPVPPVE